MKAPDKIYVAELIKQHPSTEWCVGLACKTNNLPVATTEYIHKDALLEWAKECFRLQDGGSWYSKGAADAFSKVIDKINSL